MRMDKEEKALWAAASVKMGGGGAGEISITVHPRADQKGGAADIAATYADALVEEYRKRTGKI
jgi:hypothetical protein